jgi:hypothetical protein
MVFLTMMLTTADVNIHALIAKYGIDVQIVRPEMCSLTCKGYNGMPLHVMEQPPRFFALAYRVSDACIYQ